MNMKDENKEKDIENASGGVKIESDAQCAAKLLVEYIKSNSIDFSENKGSWIFKNFVPNTVDQFSYLLILWNGDQRWLQKRF